MAATELQDNLYWTLLQVSLRAKHSLINIGDRHDLTLMQLYSLASMEMDKPVPMNFFSSILSCDASNVTGIIDRLSAQDLIVRKEYPQDRRIKAVTLTEKGNALKKKLIDEIQVHESDALRNLSKEQKVQLQIIAALVIQND